VSWQDDVALTAGKFAYYLATGEPGVIEIGLDFDGSRTPRPNATPCP